MIQGLKTNEMYIRRMYIYEQSNWIQKEKVGFYIWYLSKQQWPPLSREVVQGTNRAYTLEDAAQTSVIWPTNQLKELSGIKKKNFQKYFHLFPSTRIPYHQIELLKDFHSLERIRLYFLSFNAYSGTSQRKIILFTYFVLRFWGLMDFVRSKD